MDAAPLPEYDERLRMATRLHVAWPGVLLLTLASAPALHQLGLSGLPLVLGPALGGLVLTLAAVLHARRPRVQREPVVAASDATGPLVSPPPAVSP